MEQEQEQKKVIISLNEYNRLIEIEKAFFDERKPIFFGTRYYSNSPYWIMDNDETLDSVKEQNNRAMESVKEIEKEISRIKKMSMSQFFWWKD